MNSSQGSTLQSKYHPIKIRYNIVPKIVAKFEHMYTQHCITTLRKGKKRKRRGQKGHFFQFVVHSVRILKRRHAQGNMKRVKRITSPTSIITTCGFW